MFHLRVVLHHTHSNLKNDLTRIRGRVDEPSTALITDRKQRGWLDDMIGAR